MLLITTTLQSTHHHYKLLTQWNSPSSETYWYSYETQDLITVSKRSVIYSLFGDRLSHSTSPHPQIQFQKRNFNMTLPSTSRSPKCYAFQVFRQMKFYILISHLSCSCFMFRLSYPPCCNIIFLKHKLY